MSIRKNITILIFAFLVSIAIPKEAQAYGGSTPSTGFSMFSTMKLECSYKTLTGTLPFNKAFIIKMPQCRIIKLKQEETQFSNRLDHFIERVRYCTDKNEH